MTHVEEEEEEVQSLEEVGVNRVFVRRTSLYFLVYDLRPPWESRATDLDPVPLLNMLSMLPTYITLNDQRVSPYYTTLKHRESLIPEARPTPSSTLILAISNSLFMIYN